MSDKALREAIVRAETWRVQPTEESFEADVLPLLRPILSDAQELRSEAAVARWLEAFAVIAGAADEELADATADLLAGDAVPIAAARERLSPGARVRLGLLLEGWADLESAAADGISAPAEGPHMAGNADAHVLGLHMPAALAAAPALVSFVGESSFTSSRGFPVVKGKMTVKSRSGAVLGVFTTNCGGGASTYRRTNGPTPPGAYLISNFRVRDKLGFVRHNVGYSLDVDPVPGTQVFGRSLFRIHPDGASPGTNGCLGVFEGPEKMQRSKAIFRDLAAAGPFTATISYSGFG